jgi:hypothetical protein
LPVKDEIFSIRLVGGGLLEEEEELESSESELEEGESLRCLLLGILF